MGVGRPGRRDDLVKARLGSAVRNVFADRSVEEDGLLEDEADLAAQGGERIAANVPVIDADAPTIRVIEPGDEA